MTFESYGLDPLILDSLRALGFTAPTPVQEQVLPHILEGKDVLALAETGSGKTAACMIPLCHKVAVESFPIQVLVMVPTRELALQYAAQAQKIGKFKNISVFAIFGGEDLEIQRAKLKAGVHVLIATPGRLIDFIYARGIDLSHVKTLVLDEADEMLNLGFFEDIEFIMNCLVQEHQTLLFSATMPSAIEKISKRCMRDPISISLIKSQPTPDTLVHQFYCCRHHGEKRSAFVKTFKETAYDQVILFVDSRIECEKIYRELRKEFTSIDFLHGGLAQDIRTSVISKFSRGKIRILIATDVAARGLDFSHVTHVINMNFPRERESYLHRVGRTARKGQKGTSITFVTQRDRRSVEQLMESLNKQPEWLG